MNLCVENTFNEISFVQPPFEIVSQWQANFMQIFPLNYSELPWEHEFDKKVFEKYYQGKDKMTFEQFKKL